MDVTLSLTFTIPSCKEYILYALFMQSSTKNEMIKIEKKKTNSSKSVEKTKCCQKLQHEGHTVMFPIQVKMLRGTVYTVKSSTQGPLTALLLFFLGGGYCTVVIDVKSVSK